MSVRAHFRKATVTLWAFGITLFSISAPSVEAQVAATVNVNFSKPVLGVKNLVGFLHGLNDTSPANPMVTNLRPRCWRIGSLEHYPRLRQLGITHFEYTISDGYGYGGVNGWPYENWTKWEDYVKATAEQLKTSGVMVGVEFKLDPWNEPNIRGFWAGTFDQYCETYKRAYTVLRQVLGPDVVIGGPNESRYLRDHVDQFMNYCLANGIEVNYVNWHMQREPSWGIYNLYVDIQHLRQTYMENPKFLPLKIKEIVINEYAAWSVQYRPASILAHLYYMEKGGVSASNKACWNASWQVAPDLDKSGNRHDHCGEQTLDGITDNVTGLPLSAWHAYRAYGEGDPSSRVSVETISNDVLNQTDKRVFGIASAKKTDLKNAAQILIGNYSIVSGPVVYTDMTRNQESPATANITLAVSSIGSLPFMTAANQVKITLERIPNSESNVLLQTPAKKEEIVPVITGGFTYSLPNFPLHEVWSLTISNPAIPTEPIPVGVQAQVSPLISTRALQVSGNLGEGVRLHFDVNDGWLGETLNVDLMNSKGQVLKSSVLADTHPGWNLGLSPEQISGLTNGFYRVRLTGSQGTMRAANLTLLK